LPNYNYECLKKRGGCGQAWVEFKEIHARYHVMCPNCLVDGLEKVYYDPQFKKHYSRIQIQMPKKVNIISDIDWQDGKTGDSEFSHALGKVIRSRKDLRDAKARAREELFNSTEGEHAVMKPFRKDPDDPNSPIVMEKHTTVKSGHDMGEIYDHEKLPDKVNDPMSAFEEGKTLEQTEARIEKRLGKEVKIGWKSKGERRKSSPDPEE
jgi:hypothetical protein